MAKCNHLIPLPFKGSPCCVVNLLNNILFHSASANDRFTYHIL